MAPARRGFRFAVIGDNGSGLPAQAQIAEQLLRQYEKAPYQSVLLLGDNIYPNGDAIRYGEKKFTRLYRPLLEAGVEFKAVLGNHDICGPLGVGFPKLWLSNERENMRFFNMPGRYYDFVQGEIHFFALNTNHFKEEQYHWLDTCLAKSESPWKIVFGHHPVFSSGWHGGTPRMKRKLRPILERHRVALYLAGHEHDYERFDPIREVVYIVSGGGGSELRGFGTVQPHSLSRLSVHHFLSFDLLDAELRLQVIDHQGNVIDEASYLPHTHGYAGESLVSDSPSA